MQDFSLDFSHLSPEAVSLFKASKLSACIDVCQQALADNIENHEALFLLAGCAIRAGEAAVAQDLLEKLSAFNSEIPNAYFFMAFVHDYAGQKEVSALCQRQGLMRIHPKKLERANDLFDEAAFLVTQKDFALAASLYEEGLTAVPCLAPIWLKLGQCYKKMGNLDQAVEAFKNGILQNPALVDLYFQWASLEEERDKEALIGGFLYEEILRIHPDYTFARFNLAGRFRSAEEHEAAAKHYADIIERDPEFSLSYRRLADSKRDLGFVEEAQKYYTEYYEKTGSAGALLDHAFCLSPIIPSCEAVVDSRAALEKALKKLKADALEIKDPFHGVRGPNFYSAYFGFNEKIIQQDTAEIFRKATPFLNYVAPHCIEKPVRKVGKIKLGILSNNLRKHSVGRLLFKTILALPKDIFEITILFTDRRTHADDITTALEDFADQSFELYNNLNEKEYTKVYTALGNLGLDILFFPDIGMNVQTYFLAFGRFAPVQFTSWMHPVTSGIDTIDYFLSSKLFEVEGAQDHFTETLIAIDSSLQTLDKPVVEAEKDLKSKLALRGGTKLYVCPQSLYKIHPDFDVILQGILEKDPHSIIVLLSGAQPVWDDFLKARFEKTLPEFAERIKFVPRGDAERYHGYIEMADVLLDPPHWGGGVTSMEAFAKGVPIVTKPSPYTRARLTQGFYKMMGIEDCIVSSDAEYVRLAVEIANDTALRSRLQKTILEKADILFENTASSVDFSQFMQRALEAYYAGKTLTQKDMDT
ncbi:MAG: tetratricopeptide repeat protein [Alphaproteobacteria bacterium]